MRVLCARFGIARTTGSKWCQRAALVSQSRRPRTSPGQTPPAVEEAVLALRDAHPTWGGRKLPHRLRAVGGDHVPAPSTITDSLRRHGRIGPDPTGPRPWQSFEHAAPNEVWQLDFMGHHALEQGRVHPLTLLDDQSRFAVLRAACPHEQGTLVQAQLTACFQRYGMPRAILTDNGPPWGTAGQGGITRLEAWLRRLGIAVRHGRVLHPQPQGKIERWHRTIAADVFAAAPMPTLGTAQTRFDRFRDTYNHDRPHQALGFVVPASRYVASPRLYPATLPELVYAPDDAIRVVRAQGAISFRNHSSFVSRGLIGLPIAIRPTTTDGVYEVRYCHRVLRHIDLR